jgi:hypothetical protein
MTLQFVFDTVSKACGVLESDESDWHLDFDFGLSVTEVDSPRPPTCRGYGESFGVQSRFGWLTVQPWK